MFSNSLLAAGAVLLTASTASAGGGEKPFDLMVGDSAPPLSVREWVQGEPIESFASDQIYVVEFWATWCGPCRKAIPHMSELQAKYGDKVRFVGVSIWENIDAQRPYSVPEFVERMGDKMAYTVASDRTEASHEPVMAPAWMDAAGQRGIPTSFIVDGGKVVWIGSPFSIDEPLAEVAAGEWDLERATAEHVEAMQREAAYGRLAEGLRKATRAGDWSAALGALDKAFQEYPEFERTYAKDRYLMLLKVGRGAEAGEYGRKAVKTFLHDNPAALNAFAWGLVDPATRAENADVELAALAAHRANELTEWKDPAVLDTYALALFLSGDTTKAVEVQEKAVRFAAGTPYEGELKERLEKFKAEVGARI